MYVCLYNPTLEKTASAVLFLTVYQQHPGRYPGTGQDTILPNSKTTPITSITNFLFTNFRYNKPRTLIPIFQFTNIIFATTKNQPSSDGRASAS
jgi:hypothetical protein